ncbi:ATP-binding protein [Roseofilum casamattae]|uniref:ATP-binding protein n=1 Tax=Roseofilum casamattae BLCC-M143 TaxID=3022442 RepID=A0ABT7BUB0_9CYAN|nr:ATP-binding protein [Roseofilum casamattae]MDJ1181868.1 ATP-binding protein [Roseofilum casamattae BLCC-M143]
MGYRLSPQGRERVEGMGIEKGWSKRDSRWSREAGVAEGTLGRFWGFTPISHSSFESICRAVGVDWREVVERPLDPSFTGREEAIKTVTEFASEGYRLILIQGEGGIGKTTLAENFLQPSLFDRILRLDIFSPPIPVQELVKDWLKGDFGAEPSEHFGLNLNRLRSQLKNCKAGILIDGLETILQQGQLRPELSHYIDLLQLLSDRALKSLTLITSREPLHEPKLKHWKTYKLGSLSLEAWKDCFTYHQIARESVTASAALEEMHNAYGGNAQAMAFFLDSIKTDSDGNIEYWWQHNQKNLFCHPTLNVLVERQFEKLATDSPLAYQLLCRMGVYRDPVPEAGLWKLLWDVDRTQHRSVVRVLKGCSLVQVQHYEYSLHPIVRSQAIALLTSDRGYFQQWQNLLARDRLKQEIQHHLLSELPQPLSKFPPNLDLLLTVRSRLTLWYLANWAAGEFYLQYCERQHDTPAAVNYAFEAIAHFAILEDFEKCYRILYFNILNADNIENLRCSPHLWNHMDRLRGVIEMLQDKVSPQQAALIQIPLAIIYAESGQARKAIAISQEIITHIEAEPEVNEQSYFIRLSAYSIIGKCYRYMGNFQDAELACKARMKWRKTIVRLSMARPIRARLGVRCRH